ncbi:MAG: amidase family protein [Thermaerobacterales bacterium]
MEFFSDQWAEHVTIPQLQESMDTGELTAARLTWFFLHRIAAHDRQNASINSILEINPEALQIAEALDWERRQSGPRGPLHGIPVVLKDNIDTGDKMRTSAGTLALADSRAYQDAFVVSQLRSAGAVILAKANLTELANAMSDEMPTGYSARGGQTLNPYGPGTIPVGGSSAGSGAAVAANFAAAGIGTETSGSILNPASLNSIVAIKPTVGLVSRTGIIPISVTQDTAGPMTRSVTDAAVVLGAMTGIDDEDPATRGSFNRYYTDYTPFLDRAGLSGMRIGIPREYLAELEPSQRALIDRALDVMRAEGAVVIDPASIAETMDKRRSPVTGYEFKPALNAYLDRLAPHTPVHSLRELIDYNFKHAPATVKYGQMKLIERETASGRLTEADYIEALAEDLRVAKDTGIDKIMAEHQLDALVFAGSHGSGLAAKAGYPSITVPAGYDAEGVPLGITFTARAFEEPTLIRIAYAFEQATQHRVPPKL